MQFSKVTGENTHKVIAKILPTIYRMSKDKNVQLLMRPNVPPPPKGVDPKKHFERYSKKIEEERITKHIPMLMENYGEEMYEILAAINGVTRDEYVANLTVMDFFKDICELINDKEFVTLFPSAQSEDSSTSALENTEAT